MGQILSSPITEKHTTAGGNGDVEYAASSMQGWRVSMEDAHTTLLDFLQNQGVHFFAVYDGHGGSAVAKFAGANTHKILAKEPAFAEGKHAEALVSAFLNMDNAIRVDPKCIIDMSGCTAVVGLLTSSKVIVANAGDSRAIISCKGVAKALSYDHKPQNPEESRRISKAGGFVQYGRVNGNLALSRAMGDFSFKKNQNLPPQEQMVTVNPDIIEHTISPTDEFIVLACDGIWDCMTNQEVVEFIRPRIASGTPLSQIAEEILDHCLVPETDTMGIGCDNMSIIIVSLGAEADVRARCAEPADPVPLSALIPMADMSSPLSPPEEETLAARAVSVTHSTTETHSVTHSATHTHTSHSTTSSVSVSVPGGRDPAFVDAVLASLEPHADPSLLRRALYAQHSYEDEEAEESEDVEEDDEKDGPKVEEIVEDGDIM